MMISPESFAEMHQGKSLKELIAVRDELMKEIKDYESGKIPEEEYLVLPSPEVRYSCNLEYMTEICRLVEAAYRAERDFEDDSESVDYDDEFIEQPISGMSESTGLDPVDYTKQYETETGRDFGTGSTLPD